MIEIKLQGDYALFTRPEFKAERVTYEVLTPSAAQGILEAIFWKPEFWWQIHSIAVLRPIKRISILRNEIKSRQSMRAAKGWNPSHRYAIANDRTQRHSLCLRDVGYIVQATAKTRPHADKPSPAYEAQFNRRLQRGRCFHQPYFGCREFSAHFSPPDGSEIPINETQDFGLMLHHIDFVPHKQGEMQFWQQRDRNGRKLVKGRAVARFFRAHMEQGAIDCSLN